MVRRQIPQPAEIFELMRFKPWERDAKKRRLAAALWSEERAVHPTLTTLLMLAERDADAGRPDQQEPGARARAGGGSGPAGQP